jgi:hypothetical protein
MHVKAMRRVLAEHCQMDRRRLRHSTHVLDTSIDVVGLCSIELPHVNACETVRNHHRPS